MPVGDFLDTNILIYAASLEPDKVDVSQALIGSGAVISVQVLNEFAAVMTRKHRYTYAEVRAFLDGVRGVVRVVPLDTTTHERAIRLADRHRLSFYDAVIAAAALEAGCGRLLTEDMHAGLVIKGRLTIVNPFA